MVFLFLVPIPQLSVIAITDARDLIRTVVMGLSPRFSESTSAEVPANQCTCIDDQFDGVGLFQHSGFLAAAKS
jgi:hypothetical protein